MTRGAPTGPSPFYLSWMLFSEFVNKNEYLSTLSEVFCIQSVNISPSSKNWFPVNDKYSSRGAGGEKEVDSSSSLQIFKLTNLKYIVMITEVGSLDRAEWEIESLVHGSEAYICVYE